MPSSLSFDTRAAAGLPPFIGEPGIECADADPDLFYPEQGKSSEPARAVCQPCIHRSPCLQFALDTEQRHGIWGGRTPPERYRILTRLGANG